MANNIIKGITIEIGGDTTNLGKALDNSEKSTRSLQTELRNVEKLLKFDPSNVELLRQKQDILTDSVDETSKKLKILKDTQSQVEEQFRRGDIGADQYRAFQREILQTEKNLNGMQAELKSTDKALSDLNKTKSDAEKNTREYKEALKDANDTLNDFADDALSAGAAVAGGIGAIGSAAVAGAGYALNLSTDFDKAFNTLQTRTGATAEEMESLNTAMENVYANNFGESIEDVAESMAIVKNNTKLVGDELQAATQYALLMRDTFEFDVNESTRTAKMLMDTYGLSAEQAYNLIAQGAQNGLDKNGDLLDTINEYSVHFDKLGIDAEGMFNMLVNGAASGTFSVDKLGDAVKEFSIRAIDGSDSTAEAFEMLGFNAGTLSAEFAAGGDSASNAMSRVTQALFAMDDPVQQNTVGVNLFGTMWEDLGVKGVQALMDVSGECSTASDALENINNTKYDDIGSAIQGLGRTLQTDIVEPIGDDMKPVVEDAIEYVKTNAPQIKDLITQIVEKVGEFVGFIVDNGSTILATITGIGAGFVAWNVVTTIQGVVSAIKAFTLANQGATVAQTALNMVMNANPIGIIITVIAGLVTAFITLWNTSEGFRNFWIGLWEKIKTVAQPVIDVLIEFFTEKLPNAIQAVIEWFQALPEKITTAFSNVKQFFTDTFSNIQTTFTDFKTKAVNTFTSLKDGLNQKAQEIYNSLPTGFQLMIQNIQRIWESLKTIVENVFNIIKTVIQTAVDVIKAIFTGDFSSIPDIVSGALEKIKGFCGNIFDAIVTIVINWIAMVINYFRGWGESLINLFKSAGEKIKTWWNNLKTTCSNAAKTVINAIITFFKELPSKLYNAIVGAIERVRTWGTNVLNTATSVVKNVINAVITFFKELPSKIYNAIITAIDRVKQWGSEMLTAAKTKMTEVVTGILNCFKDMPSKMLEIGKNIISGIIDGIKNMATSAYDAVTGFLGNAVDKAKEALGINSPSRVFADSVGAGIAEGVAAGIGDNTNLAVNAVDAMSTDLANMGASVTENTTAHFTNWQTVCLQSFNSLKLSLSAWWTDIQTMFIGGFTTIVTQITTDLANIPVKLQESITSVSNTITTHKEPLTILISELSAALTAAMLEPFVKLQEEFVIVFANLKKTFEEWCKIVDTAVRTCIGNMVVYILTEMNTLPNQFYSIGVSMMVQLIAGIQSRIEALKTIIAQLKSITSSIGSAGAAGYASSGYSSGSAFMANATAATSNNATIQAMSAQNEKNIDRVFGDYLTTINNNGVIAAMNAQNAKNIDRVFGNSTDEMIDAINNVSNKLDGMSIVLDTGTLVGETITKIDSGLATSQSLAARGV